MWLSDLLERWNCNLGARDQVPPFTLDLLSRSEVATEHIIELKFAITNRNNIKYYLRTAEHI